jgi:hypothetical protein
MIYRFDLMYKTKIGYIFQLNIVSVYEIEFNLDRIYSYVYSKFNFFNNIKKRKLNLVNRFNIYHSFLEQG